MPGSLLVRSNNPLRIGDDDNDAELDLEMDEYGTKRMRKRMKRMGLWQII